MSRIVNPTGPTTRPVFAIVGEAPGREEEVQGKPFVGPSGFLLDQLLSATGVSRAECYITNVVNVRPPKNDFSVFYSDSKRKTPTSELCAHRERLNLELQRVQPQVIVPMGEEALRAVGLVTGIGNYRGCLIERNIGSLKARVLPTFHPAYILRVYGDRPIVELDLRKARRLQLTGASYPKVDFRVKPDFDTVVHYLTHIPSPVAFDIETIGSRTRCLGFAWSPTDAISVPLIWQGTHYWSFEEEHEILRILESVLSNPQIEKYVQNIPFDSTIIAKELGFHIEGISLDTMYAHHLLYSELPKGLDFLSSIYTDFPMYWGADRHGADTSNATYNCYDCCATWIAAQAIKKELAERGMDKFYNDLVHPVIFALTRMQNRGVYINTKSRDEVRVQTESKLAEALKRLRELSSIPDLNPNSPKQIAKLLYETWKLPPQRKPGTKSITTDDDALRALSRKFPPYQPFLRAVLDCRQNRKLLSSYINAKLDGGRARTSYGLAVTGRLTSSKTWDGYGGNLQNIPRSDFRRIYSADPGKILIKADYKQAEYMIFCWDAPVLELVHLYTTDPAFDIHIFNALGIFGVPREQVTKELRYDAKQGVYAGNYKIGPLKMSKMFDMEFDRAKKILERYREIRPELGQWWTRIEDEIRTTRTIRNPLGRERIFFDRVDEALFRKAYNHRCQSLVADMINRAIVLLDAQGEDLLLQVHDEIVLQCDNNPEAIRQTVARVRAAMEIPIPFPGVEPPLVIPAEISIGPNWFDVVPFEKWEKSAA